MEASDYHLVISEKPPASIRKTLHAPLDKAQSHGNSSPILKEKNVNDDDDSVKSLCSILVPTLSPITSHQENFVQKIVKSPMKSPPSPRNSNSELWQPKRSSEQSNWDSYFDSHSELEELSNTPGVGTILTPEWDSDDESCVTLPQTSPNKITTAVTPHSKDKVFVSYITKRRVKSTDMDISLRMEEIAEWLNEDTNTQSLPISEFISETKHNLTRDSKFRKQTISEAVGDSLDPMKQGLMFCVGPVDGKLCFKMSVCDLRQIKAANLYPMKSDEEISIKGKI